MVRGESFVFIHIAFEIVSDVSQNIVGKLFSIKLIDQTETGDVDGDHILFDVWICRIELEAEFLKELKGVEVGEVVDFDFFDDASVFIELNHSLDAGDNDFWIFERLLDEVVDPKFEALAFNVDFASHDDDRDFLDLWVFLPFFEDMEAIQIRHIDVEQNQIDGLKV